MTTCVLYSPLSSSLYPFLFSPQVSSSTRKARSSIGSNEPFSHSDQPLPDPISPWTYFAIVTAGPFIPRPPPPSTIHTLHPHLPTPFTLFLASLPVYSLAPGRHVCTMEIKQSERGSERGRVSELSVICAVALFFSALLVSLCCHCTDLGKVGATVTCLDWERQDHNRLLFFFCRGQRDGRMNGGTEGWIAESRDFLQCPWLSLSHALCWYSGFHYPLICISQMQHSVINKSSNYGSLSSVTVIMRPFVFVII